jgi:hypothetical protein
MQMSTQQSSPQYVLFPKPHQQQEQEHHHQLNHTTAINAHHHQQEQQLHPHPHHQHQNITAVNTTTTTIPLNVSQLTQQQQEYLEQQGSVSEEMRDRIYAQILCFKMYILHKTVPPKTLMLAVCGQNVTENLRSFLFSVKQAQYQQEQQRLLQQQQLLQQQWQQQQQQYYQQQQHQYHVQQHNPMITSGRPTADLSSFNFTGQKPNPDFVVNTTQIQSKMEFQISRGDHNLPPRVNIINNNNNNATLYNIIPPQRVSTITFAIPKSDNDVLQKPEKVTTTRKRKKPVVIEEEEEYEKPPKTKRRRKIAKKVNERELISNALAGLYFCIYGKQLSTKREDLQNLLLNHGAEINKKVAFRTTHMITNSEEVENRSSELMKAVRLEVAIVDEEFVTECIRLGSHDLVDVAKYRFNVETPEDREKIERKEHAMFGLKRPRSMIIVPPPKMKESNRPKRKVVDKALEETEQEEEQFDLNEQSLTEEVEQKEKEDYSETDNCNCLQGPFLPETILLHCNRYKAKKQR